MRSDAASPAAQRASEPSEPSREPVILKDALAETIAEIKRREKAGHE